jgi:hypothetical protein
VIFALIHPDDELVVASNDLGGVVPLHAGGGPLPETDCLSEVVAASVEDAVGLSNSSKKTRSYCSLSSPTRVSAEREVSLSTRDGMGLGGEVSERKLQQ